MNVDEVGRYKFLGALKAFPFIEQIWLYGSRARGDARVRSDIDLAIRYVDEEPYWRQAVQGIVEHADVLLPIDCIDLNVASPELREAVRKEGRLLHERRRQSENQ